MFDRIFKRLMRNETLRKAQWFYKTEPSGFAPWVGADTPCPACGACATHQSDYPSRIQPFARYTLLYCSACGLGFVPDISPETLARYYQQDYASSNRGDRQVDPEQYFQEHLTGDDPAFEKYTIRAQRQIDLLKKHGAALEKVLDYGSGPGYFLHACKAPQASAVEPDELSHKYLAYLGATIHSDFRSLPKAEFDTIVASHSVEHVPAADLHETLTALISALKPDGRLLVEVPQGGHSYLHLAGHRQDPHTLFFTGQALVEALKAAGAEILFQQAMSRVDSPRRIDPIYTGTGDPFFETARGSLTVICRP